MILLLVLLGLGAASFGLLDQGTPQLEFPAIERHRVGPIVIGADAQTVYEAFPRDRRRLVDLESEGMLSPALLVTFPGATVPDGVIVELAPQRGLVVWRIELRDPAFRTKKGIGTGSTVGQLRAAYDLGAVLSGEGRVVIRVNELSASFELDQTGPGGDSFWKLRTPETIPDSVKIISILLTQ